jgi:hypothetical protein
MIGVTMIALLPASLWADETGSAMLRSTGAVLVNRNPALPSSALFSHDLIETQHEAAARIEAAGSTADINPETVIQYDGDELVLEHGSVSVNTSRRMRVRVGCLTVTPVNADWTHYDVTDTDGKVKVSALKSDVYFEARSSNPQKAKQPGQSERVIVHESEQKSREEKCGAAEVKQSARFPGLGAALNSPWAKGAGLVGIGVLTCWALCRGDDPVSPTQP